MDLSNISTEDLKAMRSGDLSKVSTDGLKAMQAYHAAQAPSQPPAQQRGTGSAIMDGINAVTTGLNRGVVRLAGLPADTVANVVDLLKIAPGVAYTEITGKAAPDFLQPMNRENVGLTGDWLLKQARKTSPGRAIVDPKIGRAHV